MTCTQFSTKRILGICTKRTLGICTKSRGDHLIAQTRELECTRDVLPRVIDELECSLPYENWLNFFVYIETKLIYTLYITYHYFYFLN